jgi:PAS domain S-box-containing protein
MDATKAVKDDFLPDGDTADLPSETTGGRPPGRETEEREAARARGLRRTLQRGADAGDRPASYDGAAARGVTIRTFMALAENVRDYAIFLMDPDGVITYWGEGARLLKWWTRYEMEGAHLRAMYLDGGSEDGTAEDHLRQAAERGEYTGEGQRVRSDGSTFWAHVSLTALRDSDGTLLGFAKVTRDLTARHAAEAALKAAREAEQAWRIGEEANRRRAEFLTTLSHEIRTPINAILGYADLLDAEAAGSLTDRQRTHVARLRASSLHLLALVNDVLDLSRIEADRMPLGVTTARIGSAVDDALALVEPQARAKELRLVNDVSGTAADIPYYGDEGRVRQILVNLLSNAVKFTPAGGRVTVSAGTGENASPDARLSGPGPWAWIRVEDTGPGIPPERLEAIFEQYEQADMAGASHHGGTGLGVTISQRLARLMNGDLVARSEVGWGTNFFLWLPAVPDAVTPHPTVTTDPQ